MRHKIDFSTVTASAGAVVVFADFVKQWSQRRKLLRKSWDTDASRIRCYLKPSPIWQMMLRDIEPRHIAGLTEALTASGLSPSTVRRAYSLLRVIFKDAAVRGHISQSPCILGAEHLPRKSPPSPRNKVIALTDFQTLFESVPISRGGIYAALFFTGARVGEVSGLRWCDWDRARKPLGSLRVAQQFHTARGRIEPGTKTGVTKFLPIHPVLARILAAWRLRWSVVVGHQPSPDSPIFVTQIKRQNWRADSLRKALKADLARLGLDEKHTTHDLRHSFITHAQEAGADSRTLRKITHPSPRDILDQYTHQNWAQLCAVVNSIKITGVKLAL